VLDRSGRFDEAEGAYLRALESDAASAVARFYYGWHLLARVISAAAEADTATRIARLEGARECFARCVAVEPEFAEAQFGLGLTFLLADEPATDGQAHLERAWKELPSRMDIAYHAIRLSLATRRLERAREILRIVLRRFPGLFLEYVALPTEWKWYYHVAVPPSRPEEVAPLVAGALANVTDPEIRSGLEQWAKSRQTPTAPSPSPGVASPTE